ncbi:hypothetical protein [Futiania mangrovi]|uniref:Uncharacterized protein n=1 Tax=Futiania mangrovi TaxID=2959716 RepID=A0A9J6PBF6_9PROT|nr:hypothetical protein [Futiania mangrovii]MCP1335048.1 hypothetical protein [Futiania mangrovii]
MARPAPRTAPARADDRPKSKGGIGTFIGILIAGAVGTVVFVYLSGIFPYVGRESGRLEGPAAAAHYQAGFVPSETLGLKTFYYLSGQTVFVEYDAAIAAGALRLTVMREGMPESLREHVVTASGRGLFVVPIASSGLYTIGVAPVPSPEDAALPRLAYTVHWGAR